VFNKTSSKNLDASISARLEDLFTIILGVQKKVNHRFLRLKKL